MVLTHTGRTFQAIEASQQDALTWMPLRFLTFYRLILVGLLLVLFYSLPNYGPLGSHNSSLFTVTCIAYLLFSLVSGFTTRLRRPGYEIQAIVQVLVDLTAITLLMHASGGLSSGLGILMVITVAAGSLLLPGRMAFLFAAIAAISILGEYAWRTYILGFDFSEGFTQHGLLGIALFATASLAQGLASRIWESEAIAERRGADLANMATLNEHIVQRLQAGIVVTDSSDRIRLMNTTARSMLGIRTEVVKHSLASTSPELQNALDAWRQAPDQEQAVFRPAASLISILPRITLMGAADGIGALIFLEDTAALARQAQQIKLASLGRLTASIAHEIRNPLGAISHATQLLAESGPLEKGERRLTEIIRSHTRRVNTIIENVLQLSRPGASHSQDLVLKPWLEQFLDEFISSEKCQPEQIRIDIKPADIVIHIDPSHLHQALWNLCQNGLCHGNTDTETPCVELRARPAGGSNRPYLDIIDHGPGIPEKIIDQIFEPFFTTATTGTGLGLYIARELCDSNDARLNYLNQPGEGSRFRIVFASPMELSAKSA